MEINRIHKNFSPAVDMTYIRDELIDLKVELDDIMEILEFWILKYDEIKNNNKNMLVMWDQFELENRYFYKNFKCVLA